MIANLDEVTVRGRFQSLHATRQARDNNIEGGRSDLWRPSSGSGPRGEI